MTNGDNIERKEKTQWLPMIVDKLIIAGILVSFTAYLELRNSEEIEEIQTKNQIILDSINHTQQIYLSLLEARKELYLEEKEQEFELFLQKFLKNQELENTLTTQRIDFDQQLRRLRVEFQNDSLQILNEVQGDEQRSVAERRLEYITNQLKEFYWPILIRLEKNKAVYKMLKNSFVGSNIDSDVVLPNHLAVIDIIEKKIHLAQPDSILIKEITNYIGHVYMYQALRKGGYVGFPQDYKGNDYREVLHDMVAARTEYFQAEYDTLLKGLPGNKLVPIDTLYAAFSNSFNYETDSDSLNHTEKRLEIKLAYNKKYYTKSVDNSVMISFRKFVEKANFCVFKIGPYKSNGFQGGREWLEFVNDEEPGKETEEFRIEEGQAYIYKSGGKNYRVQLEKVWKEGKRSFSSLRVETETVQKSVS